MNKESVSSLEWYIGDTPPNPVDNHLPEPPSRTPWPHYLVILLAAALVFTLLVYLRYQQKSRALRAAFQDVVTQETTALQQGDILTLRSTLDPSAPELWRSTRENEWDYITGQNLSLSLRDIRPFTEDLVFITVDGMPYAPQGQGRVYRRVAGRWLWTAPSPDIWGALRPPSPLPCGQMRVYERDADLLPATTEEATALCKELTQLIPLHLRVTLLITPEQEWAELRPPEGYISLPSPWLLGATDSATRKEVIHTLLNEGQELAKAAHKAITQQAEGRDPALQDLWNTLQQNSLLTAQMLTPTLYREYFPATALQLTYLRWRSGRGAAEFTTSETITWRARRMFRRDEETTAWEWFLGDALLLGPWLRREDDCISLTYRALTADVVREAWPTLRKMCQRARAAFDLPPQNGRLRVLLTPRKFFPLRTRETYTSLTLDPHDWQFFTPYPWPQALARALTADALGYFFYLNTERQPEYIKAGVALAYLLPEGAWNETDRMRLKRVVSSQRTETYTNPVYWTTPEDIILPLSLGDYMRQTFGDEAVIAWLYLMSAPPPAPDVLHDASMLAFGQPFTDILQNWYHTLNIPEKPFRDTAPHQEK